MGEKSVRSGGAGAESGIAASAVCERGRGCDGVGTGAGGGGVGGAEPPPLNQSTERSELLFLFGERAGKKSRGARCTPACGSESSICLLSVCRCCRFLAVCVLA